jgi:hypothetical protein
VRKWSEIAGFSRFRKLPIEDPVSGFSSAVVVVRLGSLLLIC